MPNQLFPIKIIKKSLKEINKVILIEEPRYFTDFKFHKMKLCYHRISMKKYEKELKKHDITTEYIEFHKVTNTIYKKYNNNNTYYFNPIDHKLNEKLEKLLKNANKIDNLNFLLTPKEVEINKDIFYKNNKYHHDMFYKFQREKLNILIKDKKPVGGMWSYDTMNRLALPHNIKIPALPKIKKDKYYKEAISYTDKHFPNNYGSMEEYIFPTDTKASIKWLKVFLVKRLNDFGPYEDAVKSDNSFLFHSVLSPMMNIGILPDTMVVEISNKYYNKNKATIRLESFEGFIRQVIGWRNYVYAIYMLEPTMYDMNYLKHTKKISNKYWEGNTNIVPIDGIITNIVRYSYMNHIERLMYMGNWFLINMVDPKEVHRIFMEWTIDSYDWVMVPNVMGMSQYADGGKMMTRIYFSSSNYINTMSDYKKKPNNSDNIQWYEIWDAIYYNFINKHIDILKSNYATARQVAHWKKKSNKEKEKLLDIAKKNNIKH